MSDIGDVAVMRKPDFNWGHALIAVGGLLVLVSFFTFPWIAVDFKAEMQQFAATPAVVQAPPVADQFHDHQRKVTQLNAELHRLGTQTYPPELADKPEETVLKLPGAHYTSVWIFLSAALAVVALSALPTNVAAGTIAVYLVINLVVAGVSLLYTAYLGPRFLYSGFYLGLSAYVLLMAGVVAQVRQMLRSS